MLHQHVINLFCVLETSHGRMHVAQFDGDILFLM